MDQTTLALLAESILTQDSTAIAVALVILGMVGTTLLVVVRTSVSIGVLVTKQTEHGNTIAEHKSLHKQHAEKAHEHAERLVQLETVTGIAPSPRQPTGPHRAQR